MDTASAILNDSAPSLSSHIGRPPLLLQHVIRKMLAKDSAPRYQSIHEIKTDLAEILEQGNPQTGESAALLSIDTTRTRLPSAGRLWIYASVLLLCSVAASALITRRIVRKFSAPIAEPVRSVIKLKSGYCLSGWNDGRQGSTRAAMALSPDGRFIVYAAAPATQELYTEPQLYLRSLDQLEAKPIAGTEGGVYPFISPDSNWVGFYAYASGKLMKVSIAGGTSAFMGSGRQTALLPSIRRDVGSGYSMGT
jgi:hypothetical protein